VFSEEVKSRTGFVRPYNMTNLPEGEYRVVIQDETNIREESISTVKKHDKSLIGIIKASEQKVAVTFYTKQEDALRVTILNDKNTVLFSDEFAVDGQACKLFNLKSIEGATLIKVADKDGELKSIKL
jgi:hypothetical protein